MADFLFELGVEEVPVSEIESILSQLKEKFHKKLTENRVKFNSIESASTNRRFMIYINDINEKTDNKEENIIGPSKKIGIDEHGQPSIALNKFIESNNAQVTDIVEIDTKKGVYLSINKIIEGQRTYKVLEVIIPEILGNLQFGKAMLWNESRIPFVRPIKNLLALLGTKLIKCEFAGVQTSSFILGHSLLSESLLEISSFKDYIELLHKNFVIVDKDERKRKILSEIEEVEHEFDVKVKLSDNMLDYYIYNNEYPVVFTGAFEKKYLELPQEIISTFMINEKKLVPVYKSDGTLMNIFVGVSNIPDENRFVAKGNEKVTRATFEDAKFFWDNDRKDDFFALRDNLKNVMFQKNLGTFYEKTERLTQLVEIIAKGTKNNHMTKSLKEAALLCKNDLVTRMVREFPSLQGIMGGLYLKENPSAEQFWQTVYGHYEPKGYTDENINHIPSALLAMADKLDNITAFLSKGIKISGSKDPYGIRRDANSIIKIIIDLKLNLNLNSLFDVTVSMFTEEAEEQEKLHIMVRDLFTIRLENVLKEVKNIRYDIVSAVLDKKSNLFVYNTYSRASEVNKMADTESIQHLIALQKRLKNIIKKFADFPFSENLLQEPEEKILFEIFNETKSPIEEAILQHNFTQACSKLLEMKPIIDNFFDKILVMAKDKEVRENRIALLQKINDLLLKIADFSLIID